MYYLGIDGGGTKTTALVRDEDGKDVLTVCGESVNYRSEGLETAKMNMRSILKSIEAKTGISHFRAVFIGMSALSEKATDNELKAFCDGVFDADYIDMDSDLSIALAAAGGENCIAAICGTGSMAAAEKNGKVITKGGFGYILGDEGSAFAIASDALRTAVRASEGIGEPTLLTEAALTFFGAEKTADLLDKFYDPPMPRARLASFAARVTECAENGDKTAYAVIERQALAFAETVRALAKELDEKPIVKIFGGVFEHDEVFTRCFRNAVADCCADCAPLEKHPAEGAVLLSMKTLRKL